MIERSTKRKKKQDLSIICFIDIAFLLSFIILVLVINKESTLNKHSNVHQNFLQCREIYTL